MFYKQTIKAKVSIERVETAVEALNVSINEFGTVNLAYMQSIYHPDISDMIKEFEGLIFLNPSVNSNDGWEAADEYLSGNVRVKLRVAKAMMENQELSEEERRRL